MESKTIKTADVKHVLALGDVVNDPTKEFFRGVLKYSRLQNTKWTLSINAPHYQSPDPDLMTRKTIRDWGIDGMIDAFYNPAKTAELVSMGVPVIVFPDPNKEILGTHRVLADHKKVAELTAEYFAAKQYKDIAYCGIDTMAWAKERRKTFSEVFLAAGFRAHIYKQPHLKGGDPYDREISYLAQWLNECPKPIGIVAGTLKRGTHVLEACRAAHINVPEDAAVVAIGNSEFICELATPALSNVYFNEQSAGYQAGMIMDRLMKGEKLKPQKILIPPVSIVERQSSNMLAINDDTVKEAIRFIRRNTTKLLSVSEVAEAVGVTSRTLDRRFEKTLGHPVHPEIISLRMEQVCRMLVETSLPIAQIAFNIGYGDATNLNRDFKRVKGMNLSTYRKKYSLINQ